MLRWSPEPREFYTTVLNGNVVGLGSHKILQDDLALWNLYWISEPLFDQFHDPNIPPGERYHITELFPYVIGTRYYVLDGKKNFTVGDLLEQCESPEEFIDYMEQSPELPFTFLYFKYGNKWIPLMRERAKKALRPGRSKPVTVATAGSKIVSLAQFRKVGG